MLTELQIKPVSHVQPNLAEPDTKIKPNRLTPAQRFRKKLKQQENGCITFTGAVDAKNGGCGRFRVGKRIWIAHRYAWFLHHGEESAAPMLLHECHNHLCCNVEHLVEGTALDSATDRRERAVAGHRLSKDDAIQAIILYNDGRAGVAELAERYSVRESTIHSLLAGRTWAKHTGVEYQPAKPHQRKLVGKLNRRQKEAA